MTLQSQYTERRTACSIDGNTIGWGKIVTLSKSNWRLTLMGLSLAFLLADIDAAVTQPRNSEEWRRHVRSLLSKEVRYPDGATGGVVMVRLKFARNGSLVGVAIVQSSGHRAMDDAVMAAATRIKAPPRMRADVTSDGVDVLAPVIFRRHDEVKDELKREDGARDSEQPDAGD